MIGLLEERLERPRGSFSRLRTRFRRPGKLQDSALSKQLSDFEAPALVVLATALVRDNGPQAVAGVTLTTRADLLGMLRKANRGELKEADLLGLAQQIVRYVESGTGPFDAQIKYNLACFYAQQSPTDSTKAYDRLEAALAQDAELIRLVVRDHMLDSLKAGDRARFQALVAARAQATATPSTGAEIHP